MGRRRDPRGEAAECRENHLRNATSRPNWGTQRDMALEMQNIEKRETGALGMAG